MIVRRIRPLTIHDAGAIAAVLAAERGFMAPYEPVRADAFYTADGQREFLSARLVRAAAGTEAAFGILDDDGAIVGGLTLTGIVRGPFQSGSLGYWVASGANGLGYASGAVAELLVHAFDELGLHRVEAATLPDNTRSQRVLAKNGFERIGMAPAYLHIAGEWRDHLLFQRLTR